MTNALRGMVAGGLIAALIFGTCARQAPLTPPAVCQEGEDCWDWRTMGNRCGRDSLDEEIRCYGD